MIWLHQRNQAGVKKKKNALGWYHIPVDSECVPDDIGEVMGTIHREGHIQQTQE